MVAATGPADGAEDPTNGPWPAPSRNERWPPLPPGTPLEIVKVAPDGAVAARYPGTVIAASVPSPWLAMHATWVSRVVELNGLRFVPGDSLHEYFSPRHPFNAFAVFAPGGRLRGWYANVTHPAALDTRTDPPRLVWHDLYLDVVGLPDGTAAVRDEDELAASLLAERDPPLAAAILAAGDELLRRFARRTVPFHDRDRGP